MSASQKKKLRKEQNAEAMTEKQLKEAKESKKLRLATIAFAVAIVVMVCVVTVATVLESGIIERNTTALTVGGSEISAVELNHYYVDSINAFMNNYGSYASLFGVDTSKPLDEQLYNSEEEKTWADYFLEQAINTAQYNYAYYNQAIAEGYTLSESSKLNIDTTINNIALAAAMYGYGDIDTYLTAMYGSGANEESYRAYCEVQFIASQYATDVNEGLTYSTEELATADAADPIQYNSYSYNYTFLNVSSFCEGGTVAEDGTTTYSDEERAAGQAAAEEAANSLLSAASAEEFDDLISALPYNAEKEDAASTAIDEYSATQVNELLREWITDSTRTEGDMTVIPYEVTSTDDAGVSTTSVNGYYVVYFISVSDNQYPLANVRHILITPEGGTYDSATDTTTYTDEENAAAKAEAQALLDEFLAGDATEDAFAALATEHTKDTSSSTTGGLYEDVYPGQMVEAFEDWCFAEGRKTGDTGLIESPYGWHIMYYVSDSETTYRNYMIETALRDADMKAKEATLLEAAVVTTNTTKYVPMDMVLS